MNYADLMRPHEYCNFKKAEGITVYADMLLDAGYFFVPCPGPWETVHAWMKERYGEDKYTWTGEKFWFNNKTEAEEFSRAFQ